MEKGKKLTKEEKGGGNKLWISTHSPYSREISLML